jgi:hypothetical protein
MSVSKRVRFEVFKRDVFCCRYCGKTPPDAVLEIDHVEAVSTGGSDDISNLVTSCFDCNRGKSNIPLGAIPATVAEQHRRAIEVSEQIRAFNEFLMDARKEDDESIESLGRNWNDRFLDAGRYVFASGRVASARSFVRKLPIAEILEAIELAHSRRPPLGDDDERTWKYFCGICWNKIKGSR